jgi:hypothetical protein
MKSRTEQPTQFAVCTDDAGYAASLEVGKLYPIVSDAEASKHGYLRIIDESGEDYGYTARRFFVLAVPQTLADALQPRRSTRPPSDQRSARRRRVTKV